MQSLPQPWSAIAPMALYMMLPALMAAALVMAAMARFGAPKQAPAGAALGLMVGAFLGLWLRDSASFVVAGSPAVLLSALPDVLILNPGDSNWNRLPWAILASLCVGRLAYLADVHSSDGWLLRGGAAVGIAWWIIPDSSRQEEVWLTPAFALVVWLEWVVLDHLSAQPGSSSVAVALTLSLLVAGGVLIHAGTARLMDAAIVLACAFLGVWLISFWHGIEFGGAMPAIAVALPALLLMGHQTQAEEKMHWSAFALAGCAPLVLAATLPFSRWPKLWLHVVRLALILIPLAIAGYLAHEAGPLDFGEDWNE